MKSIAKFAPTRENITLPKRATIGSAGYDFFAPEDVTLPATIKTGVTVQIEPGYVLCIFPRSGLGFKYGVRLANTVGIIDSDFHEEIMIKLDSDTPIHIKKGERFAQGIFLPFFLTIDDNVEEERNGGFGSTGA